MMNLSVKFGAKGLNLGRNLKNLNFFTFLLNFLNFLRPNPLKALLEFIILGYNACVIYKKREDKCKTDGIF
mgnify:CR=1 FL=1